MKIPFMFAAIILTYLSFATEQELNSTGGQMYISGGVINVPGKMVLDSVSNIMNEGIIHADSIYSKALIEMGGTEAEINIHSELFVRKGKIILNGNSLNIYNSNPLALKRIQGGIVAETAD